MAIREADPCEPVVRATYIQVISHSPNRASLSCAIQLTLSCTRPLLSEVK
jgi:hypothetical protein